MNSQNSILSTKKLTDLEKELVINAGIGYVEYNAIEIELLDIVMQREVQNAIFTSKNAVRVIEKLALKIEHCFCVGENTKKQLEDKGYTVKEVAKNALDLGQIISKKYQKEQFLFFCGNLRRNELPTILSENNIDFTEKIVYKTHIKPRKFDRIFEGVLLFSPSGVQSYVSENNLKESIAFCIGNTTANEARKYATNVIVANKPTVTNVIVQAVKCFDKRI